MSGSKTNRRRRALTERGIDPDALDRRLDQALATGGPWYLYRLLFGSSPEDSGAVRKPVASQLPPVRRIDLSK